GTVTLSDLKDPSNDYSGTMQIKGHGNSTWGMPKKPYNLKLTSKAGLLGMASAKKWVLLANYDDKTMLRNSLAFHLSEMFGLEWTPHSKFVELYLNGNYQGTYQISEKVEIDKNRLNITEMDDTDNSGKSLTGGYLLEIDTHYGDTFMFTTPRGVPIGSEDPDPPTLAQQNYISSVVSATENTLYSPGFTDSTVGWPAYFDQGSLVKWFLVEELMGNVDGIFVSSDYLYKKRNDPRLYMGPVWDFDVSSGNTNYTPVVDPQQPWIREASWYARLFQDPAFLAAVQTQWADMRSQIGDLSTYIDSSAAALNLAQQNNFNRWPTLGQQVWPNPQAAGSYRGEVNYLKDWMTKRIAYMDANYLKK
ncbi:MAG TPA: CotH kinase family protein, partial [Edaphobacter sp.]|nr:CotH kinase family protein [Edaphobacter sp.]